jgi:hypothetical protein
MTPPLVKAFLARYLQVTRNEHFHAAGRYLHLITPYVDFTEPSRLLVASEIRLSRGARLARSLLSVTE